jgi:hypothetical protein
MNHAKRAEVAGLQIDLVAHRRKPKTIARRRGRAFAHLIVSCPSLPRPPVRCKRDRESLDTLSSRKEYPQPLYPFPHRHCNNCTLRFSRARPSSRCATTTPRSLYWSDPAHEHTYQRNNNGTLCTKRWSLLQQFEARH